MVGHVGIQTDNGPLVIPTAIARFENQLLMHGSVASGWMRLAKKGTQASVAVTQVDGIIVARSAFESSIRYHSAVIFGTPQLVADDRKLWALNVMTEKLIPGRTAEIRQPTAKEVAQTMVLILPIEEWSLKISDGWPNDGPDDQASGVWAGVVLEGPRLRSILPAPDLNVVSEVPVSVRALAHPAS
jgi:nitroimidazol reductase NimA-like FMN-containing flavoprotein (pyridoxamine 5'-phosphate oxidase superfamily)